MDAAYKVFLDLNNLDQLSSYAFELQVNAIQNLDPDRIKEYLSMVMHHSGVETCRAILHYVIIVMAKYLQIMVAYHIHTKDTDSVQKDFEKFNMDFQQITQNYESVTEEEFMPGEIPQISEVKRQMRKSENISDEVKDKMKTTLKVLPSNVEKFVREKGMTDFEETFTNEELSMDNIQKLTDDLKDIGIRNFSQRIIILESIGTSEARADLNPTKQNEKTSETYSNESRFEKAANPTLSSNSQAEAEYPSDDCSYGDIDIEDNINSIEEQEGNKNKKAANKIKKVNQRHTFFGWLHGTYIAAWSSIAKNTTHKFYALM